MDTIARMRHAHSLVSEAHQPELHVSRNMVRTILRSGESMFGYERERQPKPRINLWLAQRALPRDARTTTLLGSHARLQFQDVRVE